MPEETRRTEPPTASTASELGFPTRCDLSIERYQGVDTYEEWDDDIEEDVTYEDPYDYWYVQWTDRRVPGTTESYDATFDRSLYPTKRSAKDKFLSDLPGRFQNRRNFRARGYWRY